MENERIKRLEGSIEEAITELSLLPGKLHFLRDGYLEKTDTEAFADIALDVLPGVVHVLDEGINNLQEALNDNS